ncbi:MAG TPA: GAF domain-containing protein [Gammaproteobacteria bacterium]|nr:GAF domain-containing protein [Gammaproteobacteria bacterium]
MSLTLDEIRSCLDGVIPGVVATCAPDGTPNVSFLSQAEYVDAEHVALSFQFFSKTRENILRNPLAAISLVDPLTGANYAIDLEYLRTETQGPLFARMKAKLAGIASHQGMTGVFRLLGSDVYRVLHIEGQSAGTIAPPEPRRNLLAASRTYAEHVAACQDLHELLNTTLGDIESLLGVRHAMILMLDAPGERLYTVASRGYVSSGAGAEIPLGQGVIGMAAAERCAIRIAFTTAEYSYGRAVRESAARSEHAAQLETAIPFAGLADPQSQIAVPILAPQQRLVGVLYADSDEERRFNYEDEDALMVFASQLGGAIAALPAAPPEARTAASRALAAARVAGAKLAVRHFAENDSVFFGDDYVIKGIAGAILWVLLADYAQSGRTEFSNRALRLDPRLRFPDVNDNLEARLILLERRLADRSAPVRIAKTGRGRFCLDVRTGLELHDVPRPARR